MPYLPDGPARRDDVRLATTSSSRGSFVRGVATGFASLVLLLLVCGLLVFWWVFHSLGHVLDGPTVPVGPGAGASSPSTGSAFGAPPSSRAGGVSGRIGGGGGSIGAGMRSSRR